MTHTLRMTLIAATSALLALAGLAGLAPSADEKPIHLDDAWARQAPMGGQAGGGHGGSGAKGNGAVYVRISNHGQQADALISAASDAADTVELHEVINEGGVMKMRPLAKVAVPANGTVEMKPGGYHIMLLGLRRDLKPGDKIKVTLTFERGGPMSIEAPVR